MRDGSEHEVTSRGLGARFREEAALFAGALTVLLFTLFGGAWLADLSSLARYALLFGGLFAVMLWLAFAVVRHADALAARLGEPYGTFILTISVISIEVVMIVAVMITGGENPTLARDTLFSVLMIVMNGLVGICLIGGGLRHGEQSYNLQGASAYMGVIIPLAILGLVLPRYTYTAPGGQVTPLMGTFLILASIVLYAVFLGIQMSRHRGYFRQPLPRDSQGDEDEHGDLVVHSIAYHAVLLPLTMLPIILLSKKMAVLVDHGISTLSAPQALGGFFVAILVLSPEAMAALSAARQNRLQRTINIALGSALATIGLTIPAVLAIAAVTGKSVELGLPESHTWLLLLTILVTMQNLSSQRTNILQGVVHLTLFVAYVVLMFD